MQRDVIVKKMTEMGPLRIVNLVPQLTVQQLAVNQLSKGSRHTPQNSIYSLLGQGDLKQ